MRNIRAVLRDRYVNYTEARKLLEETDDARELLADPAEEADYDPYLENPEETEQELPSQVAGAELITEPPPPPLQPLR